MAEGATFRREWLQQTYRLDPREQAARCDEVAISMDCTFKKSAHSDYVAIQAWGRSSGRFYLLDQVRGRMSYTEARSALLGLVGKWPAAHLKLIESKANGDAILDDLRGAVPGLVGFNPTASKEARAEVAAVHFEAGDVFLPEPRSAPWVGDYVEELAAFPTGANDDQVDATAQMLIRWGSSGIFGAG